MKVKLTTSIVEYLEKYLSQDNSALLTEFKKGNEYYEKIRELDKENNLKELIDVLIQSEKG